MTSNADDGDESAPEARESAESWLLGDKNPRLLPTPWLTPYEFEEFVERLLMAQRHLGHRVRHVTRVDRWGVLGEKQEGIDLEGEFNDGVPAAWQCKHLDKLPASEVRAAVDALSYPDADEHYLVYSRVASTQARTELKKHPSWTLIDRRRLTAMLRELPPQIQKDVLDQTWGPAVRRLLMSAPGDAFVTIDKFASARKNPNARVSDLGEMVGRKDESDVLIAALDRSAETYRQVVVVSGPAGRGKSRLLSEVLSGVQAANPGVPVVCLSEGHQFAAHALQELTVDPQVVFVDDAHRSPAELAALLSMARGLPDVQVVLATRSSGRSGVVEQTARAEFGPSERSVLDVGSLSVKESRRLVDGLTADMNVSFALKNHLARQAEHSPFVAVLTTNMMRRGELSGFVGLDSDLRLHVLSRYTELLGTDIQGFSRATTQRVLATFAAIGPARLDEDTTARVAEFCGLRPIDLVRIRSEFRDNGVLVDDNDMVRVVPDALADFVLEAEAAHEDFDSGFVGELWVGFGEGHRHTLAQTLGELDWRLAHRGGPRVMASVWASIRSRMDTPFYGRILAELGQLDALAATQPADVIALLEELRNRLNEEDVAGVEEPEDPDGRPWRARFGLAPEGRGDVRAKMANLYSRAAMNDPSQLETALDALWDLRRRDSSPTNSNTSHPARMVTDNLANLGTLPHGSFPDRIVAKVAEWSNEPARPDDVTSPLFALAPLLVKEVLETVQASSRKLQFQPHTIVAGRMRDTRDKIRELLLTQALSDDLKRVGDALTLLRDALRQPHGFFGKHVGDDAILSWEEDDLATLEVFTRIADQTTIPAVRRRVRDEVDWSAEHALSLPVRHAALTLIARLDDEGELEDELADRLLSSRFGLSVVKGREVPSLADLAAARSAEQNRLGKMSEEERDSDRNERIHARVHQRRGVLDQQLSDVTARLLAEHDIAGILRLMDETVRTVQALKEGRQITAWGIWHNLADQAPEHLATVITTIADNEPGPLDRDLYILMGRWFTTDPDAALPWIVDATKTGRREVRFAIAQGFNNDTWHGHGEALTQAWKDGTNDEDPEVAQAFLGAAGALLKTDPESAVQELLDHNVSKHSAEQALDSACDYDGRPYGKALTRDQATSILRLIELTEYDSHATQEIVTGIASTHPVLVLDYLAAHFDRTHSAPDNIHGLREAYDTSAEALATWVKDHLDEQATGYVLEVATNEQPTQHQVDALTAIVAGLNGEEIQKLVEHLSSLSTWAIEHPALAHAVTAQARAVAAHAQTRPHVANAMRPGAWGSVNGHSEELAAAVARATEAAKSATDDDLKADYESAATRLQELIDELKKEDDEEDDGW